MNPINGFEGKRGGESGVIKEANSGVEFIWLVLPRKALFRCVGGQESGPVLSER